MVSLSGNLPGQFTQQVDGLINQEHTERPDKRGDRNERHTGGRDPASRTNTGSPNDTGNTNNVGNNNGVGNNSGSGNNNGIGNYGNGYGNGAPNLGGNQQPGIIGNTLSTVHQLGNSLFGTTTPLLRAPGTPGTMAASPAAPYSGNANPQAAAAQQSGPPQYSQASQSAYYGPGVRADARAQFAAMPVSVLNANTALASSARPGGPMAAAFAAAGPTVAAGNSSPAGTTGPATAATVATAMSQPAGPATAARADAAQLAAQAPPGNAQLAARADAAALAAARAAALATAATAPGTLAQATTMTPAGNPLALSAPGLTVATVPTNPAADARGVILPTHDAATSQRAENAMNPAGHTLDGAQRRQRDRRMSSMPQGGLARLLWAVGAAGHTSDGREDGSEREVRRAMQWLFWILTLIAYGCLAGAIIVFAGSDGRLADSISDRNSTAALAMCGLAAGVIAWGVARWMSRRR